MQGKYLVYDMPDPQTKVDMRGAAYFFLVGRRLYVIDVNVPLEEMTNDGPRFFSKKVSVVFPSHRSVVLTGSHSPSAS